MIGQLPCPIECNINLDLKSDDSKHTLKCNHCGVPAHCQSQQAKQQIEVRLVQAQPTPSNNADAIILQLPEAMNETAAYQLTIQRVKHKNELALVPVDEPQDDNDKGMAATGKS